MPVGPAILWPEKATKSQPRARDVDGHVGHALGGVDDHDRAVAVRQVAATSRTGLMPSTLEAWTSDTTFVFGPMKSSSWSRRSRAVFVDVDVAEDGALLFGDELPGHEVRVVLHDAEDDLVAGAEVGAAPGVGDQVERLCSVAGEDDAAAVGRLDEARDLAARAFVGLGGLFGKLM